LSGFAAGRGLSLAGLSAGQMTAPINKHRSFLLQLLSKEGKLKTLKELHKGERNETDYLENDATVLHDKYSDELCDACARAVRRGSQ
jgi:hypothetical protein